MPRKATTPKPITFALTSDKTGVTLKVGNSPTTAATLYPRHVTELANLLGMNREGVVEKSLRAQLDAVCRDRDKIRAEMSGIANIGLDRGTEITNLRIELDAAIADRNVWEKAAKEDRAQLVTLADELNRERQKLRDIEKLRVEALVERDATILGWRLATVAAVFVAIALAIWKGGAR